MKYLVLILVVLGLVWMIRRPRGASDRRDSQPRPNKPTDTQDMVRCPVCDLHLPRSDALPGPYGQLYCCAEHRQRDES